MEVLLESLPFVAVPAVLVPVFNSTSRFYFVPRASPVSTVLLVGFLRTDLRFCKPNFVPTRCSSDEASRLHQQPLIHLFVSLALALRGRGSKQKLIHQRRTRVMHTDLLTNIGMAFFCRVAL